MKTVQSVEAVTVKVVKSELLKDRWLSFQLLSKKLGDIEQEKGMAYKRLRNRLYNSKACGKYSVETIAGILYVDTKSPMKGKASLELSFEVTE